MKTDSAKYGIVYKNEIAKIENKLSRLILDKKPKSLYDPCSYILNGGGKRLRPFLLLISAKAVGGDFKNVYNAATAVEVLHNFTLVHDDIMDNSNKRRGRPTLHNKYDLS
ncbi:MAG: polyprenyl synthetase family protein, partial [Melioribacteraceae bacterium]